MQTADVCRFCSLQLSMKIMVHTFCFEYNHIEWKVLLEVDEKHFANMDNRVVDGCTEIKWTSEL